jgi:hypothetical protein
MQHRLQTIEYRIETNLLHIPYAGTQSIDCQTLTPVSLTPTVWFFWGLQPSCKWPLFLALNSLTLKKGGKPVKRKIAWPRPMSSSWCLCPGKGKDAKTGWGERRQRMAVHHQWTNEHKWSLSCPHHQGRHLVPDASRTEASLSWPHVNNDTEANTGNEVWNPLHCFWKLKITTGLNEVELTNKLLWGCNTNLTCLGTVRPTIQLCFLGASNTTHQQNRLLGQNRATLKLSLCGNGNAHNQMGKVVVVAKHRTKLDCLRKQGCNITTHHARLSYDSF